jgi:hypothetical protein
LTRICRHVSLLSLLALALVIGNCSTKNIRPAADEIDVYLQNHPDIPQLDKRCILDGTFSVGMKQETVKFLLGPPEETSIVHQPWATQKKWKYSSLVKKTFILEDKHVVGIIEN